MSDQAILGEYARHELRVVAECPHLDFRVHHTLGGGDLTDNVTEWGHCPTCQQWIARTHWLSCRSENPADSVEDRPMTERELSRLQEIENHYRWSDQ